MRCPKCGTAYPDDPDANFCELDGTRLISETEFARVQGTPTAGGSGCAPGACVDDGDGYCAICGRKIDPAPLADTPPMLPELAPTPYLGAVTNRGKRHPTNQDAVAVAVETVNNLPVPVIVVCDGVSSARHSEATAAEAVHVTLAHLTGYVASVSTHVSSDGSPPAVTPPPAALERSPLARIVEDASPIAIVTHADAASVAPDASATAMRAAIIAAHEAICALDDEPDDTLEPPGCTVVVALVEETQMTIGWVGDSRAYLLSENDPRLLTHDHSYVNELLARGELTEDEAMRSQYAHVITLCLGPLNSDAAHPPEPSIIQIPRECSGMLVLCTDGLWNYAPDAAFLARLSREAGPAADAQTIARHLVTFANAQGGQDNITVAVIRLGDLPPPGAVSPGMHGVDDTSSASHDSPIRTN